MWWYPYPVLMAILTNPFLCFSMRSYLPGRAFRASSAPPTTTIAAFPGPCLVRIHCMLSLLTSHTPTKTVYRHGYWRHIHLHKECTDMVTDVTYTYTNSIQTWLLTSHTPTCTITVYRHGYWRHIHLPLQYTDMVTDVTYTYKTVYRHGYWRHIHLPLQYSDMVTNVTSYVFLNNVTDTPQC